MTTSTSNHSTVRVTEMLWHGRPVWVGEFSNSKWQRWWRHGSTPEAALEHILPVFESVMGRPFTEKVDFTPLPSEVVR